MAKIKSTIIKIKGKLGDEVFYKTKHGNLVRKAVAEGSKKNEPAFKKQYSRTNFINGVASPINRIMQKYDPHFVGTGLYGRMQKRFRIEPLNERFLVLLQLKGFEINPDYPLQNLGGYNTSVIGGENEVSVNLQILSHPESGKHKANSYYNEVMWLQWTKSSDAVTVSRQRTEWMSIYSDRFEIEFLFPKPADATHWVLCVRQRLGINERLLDFLVTQGMQIVDVGTFDKAEQEMLINRKEDEAKQRGEKTRKIVEDYVPVVKAKRVIN
ncbi:MAG: hypothetical protein ABI760_20335 [Ferruginibacter sp.]